MVVSSYERLPEESKLIFLAGIFDGEGSFGEEKGRNGKKGQKVEMSYVSFCCCVVIIVLTFAPTFNNRKRHIFLLIFVNHLFETK